MRKSRRTRLLLELAALGATPALMFSNRAAGDSLFLPGLSVNNNYVVPPGRLLTVGGLGVNYFGGGTPIVNISGAASGSPSAVLILQGDVRVSDPSTRATLAGPGTFDLGGGTRRILTEPSAQLSISAPITNGDLVIGSGVETDLQGTVRVTAPNSFAGSLGIRGGHVEAVSGGLGTAVISVDRRGTLLLSGSSAANSDLTVTSGRLDYFASGATGGHLVAANGASNEDIRFNGSVVIGTSVASVMGDRFQIGTENYLRVKSATANLLSYGTSLGGGVNLTLASRAIVGMDVPVSIANLPNNNSFYYFPVTSSTVHIGGTNNTNPWRGLSSGANGEDATFNIGTVIADGDFELQALSAPLSLGTRASDTNNASNPALAMTISAANPVTATIRGKAGVILQHRFNGFSNVAFLVPDGSLLVLDAFIATGQNSPARGIEVQPGGVLQIGSVTATPGLSARPPSDQELGYLRGGGLVHTVDTTNGSTVRLVLKNPTSDTFSGVIEGPVGIEFNSSNTSTNPATLTLSGRNVYLGATTVSAGILSLGADEVIPDTSIVNVGNNGKLSVNGKRETIGGLTGSGAVDIGGGTLRAGMAGVATSFLGSFSGTGAFVTVGSGTLDLTQRNGFAGDLELRGGLIRLSGGGKFPDVNSVGLFSGGTLETNDLSSPTPRVNGLKPVLFNGGTWRLLSGSQVASAMMPVSGASTINLSNNANLTFASLSARTAGATINFNGAGSTGNVFLTGTAAGPMAGWAIVNGSNFAEYRTGVGVVALGATNYTSTPANGANVRISGSTTIGNLTPRTLTLVSTGVASLAMTQTTGTTIAPTANTILKTGTSAATISGGTITNGNTAAGQNDVIFYVNQGDLDVSSRIANTAAGASVAMTKGGAGRLILSGAQANTYTGTTFVNEGELFLNRSTSNASILGNVVINGGTLRLGAAEQIKNTSAVIVQAGAFRLNGKDETIGSISVQDGMVETGGGRLALSSGTMTGGVLVIGTASASPAPVGAPMPDGPVPAAPADTATLDDFGFFDGEIQVMPGQVLGVGAVGLKFRGGKTPQITLMGAAGSNAAGRLSLHGDVSVLDNGTSARIDGAGVVDLNGVKVFTPLETTELIISAKVEDGSFRKSGPGALRLSGLNAFNQPITIENGTLQISSTNALGGGTFVLGTAGSTSAAALSLKFAIGATRVVTAGANIQLISDSSIEADEQIPDPQKPGKIVMGTLTATSGASLRILSSHRTVLEFSGPVTLNNLPDLNVDETLIFSNAVSGSFFKTGPGILRLTGTPANQVTSRTGIFGGVLELQKPSVNSDGGPVANGGIAIGGSLAIDGGGGTAVVKLLASNQIADDAIVSISSRNAALDLNGFDEAIGSLSVSNFGLVKTGGGMLRANSIFLSSGGKIQFDRPSAGVALAAGTTGAHAPFGGRMLVTKSLSLTGGASIDLANNGLVYDYAVGAASPITTVRQHLLGGYSGGAWSGTGLASTVAGSDRATALGYAEASDILGLSGAQTANYFGATVDATSVLVRYTRFGDANLSGGVDFADLVRLAQNYNQGTGKVWFQGDFDYNGAVDFNDLVKLAQNYNQSIPAEPIAGAAAGFEADWALAMELASVPEPAVPSLAAGAVVMLGRRTRRRE